MAARGPLIKMLQQYWRLTRAVTMGAQAIVVDGESRVLLVRHGYQRGWHFPGGGVERGETVMDALKRELLEEAGVRLSGAPQLVGIYANFEKFPGDHIVLFLVRAWQQAHTPAPGLEIRERRFFALDAMPEGASPGTLRRMAEVFGEAARSETW